MARTPVTAAGGIVLRRQATPLFAVVRLRKRNEWVLPKGKLDDGETARDAAEREVLEETGHAVRVHEFLGTLVYESGGRFKVVHYWRMEAGNDGPVRELMDDVKAVDWLPLEDALDRLSRGYERSFLEAVGPLALQSAQADRVRHARSKAIAAEKRRQRRAPPAIEAPAVVEMPEIIEVPLVAEPVAMSTMPAAQCEPEAVPQVVDAADPAPPFAPATVASASLSPRRAAHRNLLQRVRDWLSRAA